MGQRANLIIIRGSDARVYYDHWCANRLDVELFWGPNKAEAFIQQLRPVGPEGWLDEVWCEGGAILDANTRTLTWFGGEDLWYDIPLRRMHLELMRTQWGDWQIDWAHGGILELGAKVGAPASMFLVAKTSEAWFEWNDAFPDDNNALITVRRNGITLVSRMCGDEEALQMGSSQLHRIFEFEMTPALTWTGEMPTFGVHLDADEKKLEFWSARPTTAAEERVASAWPDWEVVWLRDAFERQLEAAMIDIQLPVRDAASLRRAIIEQVRHRCHREGQNPARELASRLNASELNPMTDEARGSVGTEEEKLRTLDKLAGEFAL